MKTIKELQQDLFNLLFNTNSETSQSAEMIRIQRDILRSCIGYFVSGLVCGVIITLVLTNL